MSFASSRGLKSSYKIEKKHEAFFTGGKVQITNDGEKIFCPNNDKIEILSSNTGTVESSISKDEEEFSCFVLSCNNEHLISASKNGLLHQWDWRDGKCIRTWKSLHNGPIAKMCFDSTSTLLATGGVDASIKVWDIIKQYCTHHLRGAQGVFSVVKFHPEIKRLQIYGSADDNNIRVWDLKTSQMTACLDNSHFSQVTALSFYPNGNYLLSSGRDKVVILWDIVDFKIVRTIPVYETIEDVIVLPQGVSFPHLNVSDDQIHFMTAGSDGVFKIWQSDYGRLVYTHPEKISSSKGEENELNIVQCSYNPQTNLITSVTVDHNIIMHSFPMLKVVKQFVGYNDEVLDVKFVGDGESHILVATNSPDLKLFERQSFSCMLLKGHKDIVLAINVFQKMKSVFVSGGKDNEVRVWKMDSNSNEVKCIAVGLGHALSVGTLCCSNVTASFFISGSQDTTMKIWDIPNGTCKEISNISPKFTEKCHDKDVNSIALSPNDKLIATASQDKSVKIWNSANNELMGIMRGHKRGVWSVVFSPVDQVIASSSADGLIKIWAISDFSCVKTFEGHDSSVLNIVFLTRGMQILSSASDGLLKLWNIKQNECVKTMDGHSGKIWAMTASTTEDYILTGADDSNIIIWKDDTENETADKLRVMEEVVEQEQQLSNLLHNKKYVKALKIAISLDRPYKVLTIIKEILDESDGKERLQDTIKKLRNDQIDALLGYCVKWNTNSKTCHPSQFVLSVILNSISPDDILKFSNSKSHLEGLISYSERHIQRMNRLLQQAMFINYTWGCIKTTASAQENMELNNDSSDEELNNEDGMESSIVDERLRSNESETQIEENSIEPTQESVKDVHVGTESPLKKRRKIGSNHTKKRKKEE